MVKLVRDPWSSTKVFKLSSTKRSYSSLNKEGYGLKLVNNRLFCNICNVPVLKVSQYLITDNHQKVHKSRKQCYLNKNNLNSSV